MKCWLRGLQGGWRELRPTLMRAECLDFDWKRDTGYVLEPAAVNWHTAVAARPFGTYVVLLNTGHCVQQSRLACVRRPRCGRQHPSNRQRYQGLDQTYTQLACISMKFVSWCAVRPRRSGVAASLRAKPVRDHAEHWATCLKPREASASGSVGHVALLRSRIGLCGRNSVALLAERWSAGAVGCGEAGNERCNQADGANEYDTESASHDSRAYNLVQILHESCISTRG